MPTIISEQVKILASLQEIDFKIHEHRQVLTEFPAEQAKVQAEIEAAKSSMASAEKNLKDKQVAQKNKELDLATKEEKVKKLQGQLSTLKTNKEYQAMELEIKSTQADNSLIEEEILQFFDQIEDAKKALEAEKLKFSEVEKTLKAKIEASKKQAASLEAEVQQLTQKRQEYIPSIEPKILVQYEKLLKGLDGLAIVAVTSGSCGGCQLKLRPQFLNEVQSQDKLHYCESCARMLYWPSN